MDNIVLTEQEITEQADFIATVLSQYDQNIDVSPASVAYTWYVRPNAIIQAYLFKKIELLKNSRNIDYIKNMEDSELRDELADALLSSLFITRKGGEVATGTLEVRTGLYEDLVIPAGTLFYSNTSYPFELDSSNDFTVYKGDMKQGLENSIEYFYFDVPIKSTGITEDFFLNKDQIVSTNWTNPNIIIIKAKYEILPAKPNETTDELLERAENAPSITLPITERAANNIFLTYPNILKVLPIGARDSEMSRSKITTFDGVLDVKNMVDYYLKGSVKFNETTQAGIEQIDHNGTLTYCIILPEEYFLKIKEIRLQNGILLPGSENGYKDKIYIQGHGDTVIGSVNDSTILDHRLSREHKMYIPLGLTEFALGIGDPPDVDYKFDIIYDSFTGLHAVQDYLLSSDERMLCFSPLVKSFMPVYISGNIEFKKPLQTTETVDEITLALRNFINNRKENLLTIQDIYMFLNTNYNIVYVKAPITLTATYVLENLTIYEKDYIDEISIDSNINNNPKYTSRLFTFVADENLTMTDLDA